MRQGLYALKVVQPMKMEITLFEALETPFGLFYWNPEKLGLAICNAVIFALLLLLSGLVVAHQTDGIGANFWVILMISLASSLVSFLKTVEG